MRTITLVWALLALNWSLGAAIHLHDGDFLPWFANGIPVMLSMIGALLIVTNYVLPALRALRRAISRRMPWADA